MLQVNDAIDALLLGSFFFGLVFSVLLLFVGDVLPEIGAEGDGDGSGAVPINLSTLLAFVAWFGGVGYLARNAAGWSLPPALAAGVAGGLVGAAAVGWVVSRFVTSREGELDPADFRLPGTIGRVTSSIRANGTGEVVYEQGGVRRVTGARAGDGAAIPRGAEVVVLRSAGGIAVVEPADRFFGDDALALAPRRGTDGGVGESARRAAT
jgi:membrane protein implicated in regulation of membrane protease activity